MSDIRNQHGMISWAELITPDPAAAAELYGKVYGWTSETMTMPDGNTYTIVLNGEGSKVAGIMAPPPQMPDKAPPHWGLYVTVEKLDEAVSASEANGGKTLVPAFDVSGVGRMAHIQDPQGACIALITYETPMGSECS